MTFKYGSRLNKGDYFSTKIDIENQTAETQATAQSHLNNHRRLHHNLKLINSIRKG